MYERKHEKLKSIGHFYLRLSKHVLAAFTLILFSLCLGILGYHQIEGFSWIDSLLNAAMILGGMGEVNELKTDAGKIFAALYALYSGLVVIVATGFTVAPVAHRILHHFHFVSDREG